MCALCIVNVFPQHNHENPVLTETFSEQLEECDRYSEDAAFMRIDRKSHAVTHQVL